MRGVEPCAAGGPVPRDSAFKGGSTAAADGLFHSQSYGCNAVQASDTSPSACSGARRQVSSSLVDGTLEFEVCGMISSADSRGKPGAEASIGHVSGKQVCRRIEETPKKHPNMEGDGLDGGRWFRKKAWQLLLRLLVSLGLPYPFLQAQRSLILAFQFLRSPQGLTP